MAAALHTHDGSTAAMDSPQLCDLEKSTLPTLRCPLAVCSRMTASDFLRPCPSAGMIPQFNISSQTAIRTRATGEECWQLKLPAVVEPYKNQRDSSESLQCTCC
jgi:hypothetical protein